MSYSFNCRGADKAALKSEVAAELDKVVEQQPIHTADRDVAEDTAGALIDVVRDPTDKEAIVANVHGSCWKNESDDGSLSNVSLTVSISFAPK